jgi:hypothetical protein
MLAPLKLQRALEGKSSTQVRKYRANHSTRFALSGITDQSTLKRMNVGGSLRWEDRGSIGYFGVEQYPETITELDANNPIWAKSNYYLDLFASYRTRLFNDKVGATFQINVRNLQESGSLRAVGAFPNGETSIYRIMDPRQVILTATFDF